MSNYSFNEMQLKKEPKLKNQNRKQSSDLDVAAVFTPMFLSE